MNLRMHLSIPKSQRAYGTSISIVRPFESQQFHRATQSEARAAPMDIHAFKGIE